MWCIPCKSSNSLIPRQHVGTSFSSLINHFLFTCVSTAAFFSEGTNTAFIFNPNSAINCFSIPSLHFIIISSALFVRIFQLSSAIEFTQLRTMAESVLTSITLNPHFKAKLTPFNTNSNSVTLIWL